MILKRGHSIHIVPFWHNALLLFLPPHTLFSNGKTSVEMPINKAMLQEKKEKRKSIELLCELLNDQQEQAVAVKVCNV